jgi:uncharacterized repeat protein (TIGR01451 family)
MLHSSARLTRLVMATIVALAVYAGAAGSAQAAANCPPGSTAGNKLCLETTHSPGPPDFPFVTQNSVVTYRVVVRNPDTATATKVTMQFALDPRATLVSTPPRGCSQPSSTNVISCDLGSVKPTGSNPLVFLFSARMPGTAAITSSVASISADARQNDKQENPNDPTQETFSDEPEVVEVRVVEGQAISGAPDGITVPLNTDTDGSGATNTDKRTAKFTLLAIGFSTTATINDSVDDSNFVCPQGLKCPSGGWTESFIPGPGGLLDPFIAPSQLEIELRYDASTIPAGLTPAKYVLLHDLDYLASTTDYEQISQLCGGNPTPPCLIGQPVVLPDGDFLVRALVKGNWRYR